MSAGRLLVLGVVCAVGLLLSAVVWASLQSSLADLADTSGRLMSVLSRRGEIAQAVSAMTGDAAAPPRCVTPLSDPVPAAVPAVLPVRSADCVRFAAGSADPTTLWSQPGLRHSGHRSLPAVEVCFVSPVGLDEPAPGPQAAAGWTLRCVVWSEPGRPGEAGRLTSHTYPAVPDVQTAACPLPRSPSDRFDPAVPWFADGTLPAGCPQPRIDTFEEVAGFAAFFLGTDGDWLTSCGPAGQAVSGSPAECEPEPSTGSPPSGRSDPPKLKRSSPEAPHSGSPLAEMRMFVCPHASPRSSPEQHADALRCIETLRAHAGDSDPATLEETLETLEGRVWRFSAQLDTRPT